MARKTSKQTLARPSIARQIVKNIEKIQQRKIIDLEEWHQARHRAENLEATVASDEKLSRLDPLHALHDGYFGATTRPFARVPQIGRSLCRGG
jgi:hypothetical protein